MISFCNRRPDSGPALSVGRLVAVLLVAAAVGVAAPGCTGGDDDGDDDRGLRPLQPLVYTEYPELTPQGAAVRERRLERQLLEGSADGSWGRLAEDADDELPSLARAEVLGEAIVDALVDGDERLWGHAFVDPRDYAQIVGVDGDDAGDFVDNQMGESLDVWELFSGVHPAKLPDDGLWDAFAFDGLELGSPRTVDGGPTDADEAVQFWNNELSIRVVDTDLVLSLEIPRIFRTEQPGVDEEAREDLDAETAQDAGNSTAEKFQVGSSIEAGDKLEMYFGAGLHLDALLLRSEEYPFPLGVGSFWRYERYEADEEPGEQTDRLDERFDERADGVQAEEVIVEVREVSRYGTVRLVDLLRSYDDRKYTRVHESWALTPHRIYRCSDECRNRIDELDWLLGYFASEEPIMVFPVEIDDRWGTDSNTGPTFTVDGDWHEVETRAGTFDGSFRIEGTGRLEDGNRYHRDAHLVRYFAPGRGIVRRTIDAGETSHDDVDVVEELVEYRIMD